MSEINESTVVKRYTAFTANEVAWPAAAHVLKEKNGRIFSALKELRWWRAKYTSGVSSV